MNKIDFVIPWVNGKDKKWINKKNTVLSDWNHNYKAAATDERFRDYGTLLFLFRSIEKYAPWVNKIYLVTDHQKPDWLLKSEKVRIVDHTEIIDKKYLPIFNSSVIEMNIYKIKGLMQNFVYFNDDMILNKQLTYEDFFKNNLPCDSRIYNGIVPTEDFDYILLSNGILLNKYLNHRWPLTKKGIFNYRNGINQLRNFLFLPQLLKSGIPGYLEPHGPLSFNKDIFLKANTIWKEEIEKNNTHRFRELNDVTIWLIRHLQLELGSFTPRKSTFTSFYTLNQTKQITLDLEREKSSAICINDKNVDNYNEKVKIISQALNKKFPVKSKFEK